MLISLLMMKDGTPKIIDSLVLTQCGQRLCHQSNGSTLACMQCKDVKGHLSLQVCLVRHVRNQKRQLRLQGVCSGFVIDFSTGSFGYTQIWQATLEGAPYFCPVGRKCAVRLDKLHFELANDLEVSKQVWNGTLASGDEEKD